MGHVSRMFQGRWPSAAGEAEMADEKDQQTFTRRGDGAAALGWPPGRPVPCGTGAARKARWIGTSSCTRVYVRSLRTGTSERWRITSLQRQTARPTLAYSG